MRAFVTGGNGFIGNNLVKELVQKGWDVRYTITGGENDPQGGRPLYLGLTGLDWHELNDIDAVFHLAANNDTRSTQRYRMLRSNLDEPIKLFHEAADRGCRKFIYASSTAVYGKSPTPFHEGTQLNPLTPYAESKIMFDKFAMGFAEQTNSRVVGLRFCNVYGPGEERKGRRMSMIGQMLRHAADSYHGMGGRFSLFEDGNQKRDWLYVADAVRACLLAEKSGRTGIYNIGTGTATSFNELTRIIEEHIPDTMGDTIYTKHPFPAEYQDDTTCSIEKANKELAYSPLVDIHRGIGLYLLYISASAFPERLV